MKRRTMVSLLVASFAVLLSHANAHAAFSGENGLLAFADIGDVDQGTSDIFVVRPDGTGRDNLTNTPTVNELEPAWSADGTQIAFSRSDAGAFNDDIWIMNADGSNLRQVTFGVGAAKPAWSPDGTRIAFALDGSSGIGVVNADGSNPIILTPPGANADDPRWSPDGELLVFWSTELGSPDIFTMRPDGTDQQRLTTDPGLEFGPDWSPDGSQIVFSGQREGDEFFELFIMNADGSGLTQFTNRPDTYDSNPVWSPDGDRIAWETCGSGVNALLTAALDGSDLVEVTTLSNCTGAYPDWQPIPSAVKNIGINIQPFDPLNRISLAPWAIVAVAYLSDPSFDATTIDATSACFGDAEEPGQRTCGSLFGTKLTFDVDSDGDRDAILFFSASRSGIDPGDRTACATAEAPGMVRVQGCDRIRIVR